VTGPGHFRVFREADAVAAAFSASVLAFGKFDGVHLGHRALLERAAAAGRRLGLPHGAATFERHPHANLRGGRVPPALTSLADKLRLLCETGAHFVVLFPTDPAVLGLPAEDFARHVLRERMGVRLVVVGENFRFGRGGAGDVATLRRLTTATGLDGVEIGMTAVGGEVASATGIRQHLASGNVTRAAELLGRPHEVLGRAVGGGGTVSRSLAALVPAAWAVPAAGVYQASVAACRPAAGRRAALVTVHPEDSGPHRLDLEWPGSIGPDVEVGRGVRVAFEARV
jgi:riboflavin kinase/FMN adenylyltransferase